MKTVRTQARLATAFLAATLLHPATASTEPVNIVGDGVQLRCAQPEPTALSCDFRPTAGAPIGSPRASLGGRALPVVTEHRDAAGPTAVLLMVDASALAASARHVRAIVAAAEPHHAMALAAFDSELEILAPFGSSAEALRAAAGRLPAPGKATELYRNATLAIRTLARHPAERRALFLFSDGIAEDRAYFHDDVVGEALERGVVIFAVGYPRSEAAVVELQTLRRLADETGGSFVAARAGSLELPDSFLDAPFGTLDSGGRLEVDLTGARLAVAGPARIALEWPNAAPPIRASVPVALPIAAPEPVVKVIEVPKIVEVPKVVEVPVTEADAPDAMAPEPAPMPVISGFWPAVIVLGTMLVAAVGGVLAWLRRSRPSAAAKEPASRPSDGPRAGPEPESRADPGATDARPRGTEPEAACVHARYAYLEVVEGGERHAVRGEAFRIGRHKDNDLVLKEPSLSRHHAEIARLQDGTFTLTDLESMNGVYVNGKKRRRATLADGDLVELGDLSLRFSLRDDEEPVPETVVLRTVATDRLLAGDNDDDEADDRTRLERRPRRGLFR